MTPDRRDALSVAVAWVVMAALCAVAWAAVVVVAIAMVQAVGS